MRLVAFLVVLLLSTQANARLAPDAVVDPELHAWFERQHAIDGTWCCDLGDGHMVEADDWRHSDDGKHYEVRIEGGWRQIEPGWLRRTDEPNPTGKGIVWYRVNNDESGLIIYCFAPGPEF